MPQLVETIQQYQDHLQARGLGRNTIKNRTQVLRRAVECWGNIQPASVRHRHVDRLFSTSNWSASTRNLYLGNLRLYFRWCRSVGYVTKDFDPTDGWSNVRVPREDRLRVPVHQFPELLNACQHPRDRALVAVGLFCFLRGSEIRTLRVSDLDLRAGELSIYRHKTKEEDVLPVSLELRMEMRTWLDWYRPQHGNWFLIPAKHKNTFIRDQHLGRLVWDGKYAELQPSKMVHHPWEIVATALRRIGLAEHGIGVHTLRRSGARALFDQLRGEGYDGALMRVSSMLGHSDTRVTEKYIGLSLERTQRNELIEGAWMFGDVFSGGGLKVVGDG